MKKAESSLSEYPYNSEIAALYPERSQYQPVVGFRLTGESFWPKIPLEAIIEDTTPLATADEYPVDRKFHDMTVGGLVKYGVDNNFSSLVLPTWHSGYNRLGSPRQPDDELCAELFVVGSLATIFDQKRVWTTRPLSTVGKYMAHDLEHYFRHFTDIQPEHEFTQKQLERFRRKKEQKRVPFMKRRRVESIHDRARIIRAGIQLDNRKMMK